MLSPIFRPLIEKTPNSFGNKGKDFYLCGQETTNYIIFT